MNRVMNDKHRAILQRFLLTLAMLEEEYGHDTGKELNGSSQFFDIIRTNHAPYDEHELIAIIKDQFKGKTFSMSLAGGTRSMPFSAILKYLGDPNTIEDDLRKGFSEALRSQRPPAPPAGE